MQLIEHKMGMPGKLTEVKSGVELCRDLGRMRSQNLNLIWKEARSDE